MDKSIFFIRCIAPISDSISLLKAILSATTEESPPELRTLGSDALFAIKNCPHLFPLKIGLKAIFDGVAAFLARYFPQPEWFDLLDGIATNEREIRTLEQCFIDSTRNWNILDNEGGMRSLLQFYTHFGPNYHFLGEHFLKLYIQILTVDALFLDEAKIENVGNDIPFLDVVATLYVGAVESSVATKESLFIKLLTEPSPEYMRNIRNTTDPDRLRGAISYVFNREYVLITVIHILKNKLSIDPEAVQNRCSDLNNRNKLYSSIYFNVADFLELSKDFFEGSPGGDSPLDLIELYGLHMANACRETLLLDFSLFTLSEFIRIHRENGAAAFPVKYIDLAVHYMYNIGPYAIIDDRYLEMILDFLEVDRDDLLKQRACCVPLVIETNFMKERYGTVGTAKLLTKYLEFIHRDLRDLGFGIDFTLSIHNFVELFDLSDEDLDMNKILRLLMFDMNRYNGIIYGKTKTNLKPATINDYSVAYVAGNDTLKILSQKRPDLICTHERVFSEFVATYKLTVEGLRKGSIPYLGNDKLIVLSLVPILSNLCQFIAEDENETIARPAASATIEGFDELYDRKVRGVEKDALELWEKFRDLHYVFESLTCTS